MAEKETKMPLRIAFEGLWTAADREGRFTWRPEALKLDCLPYDDLDFSKVLEELRTRGFIEQYNSAGSVYGWIPSFLKHQVINCRERPSELPNPLDATISTREQNGVSMHVHAQGEVEGKGREEEGKGKDASVTRGRSKQSRTRSHTCPDDFELTEELKDWARAERADLDLKYEEKKFRLHDFKDPHSDWARAWKNWILGARVNGNRGLLPIAETGKQQEANSINDDPSKWTAETWNRFEKVNGKQAADKLRKETGKKS